MADSSATTLSLHSDEGYSRSVVPSTQDAIPIFTRLDVFNTLCHSKENWWQPQLREGKGAISATSFVFCCSACQTQWNTGTGGARGKAIHEKHWSSPDREHWTHPELLLSTHWGQAICWARTTMWKLPYSIQALPEALRHAQENSTAEISAPFPSS